MQAWLEELQVTKELIQQHLHRACQCMKSQDDKKRSFRTFQVSGQVFLKLQPYIQTSLAPHANHKLSFKFFRPFPIIRKINKVAYELQLPPSTTVHPIFHVLRLRQAFLPGTTVAPELLICTDELAVPVEVLHNMAQAAWLCRRASAGELVRRNKPRHDLGRQGSSPRPFPTRSGLRGKLPLKEEGCQQP